MFYHFFDQQLSLKSINIEVFGGVCVCCPLVFEFSVGIGGFVIGLGQISFFFSLNMNHCPSGLQFFLVKCEFENFQSNCRIHLESFVIVTTHSYKIFLYVFLYNSQSYKPC